VKRRELREQARRKNATKAEVAREYGVSLRTIDTWIAQRKIPFRKLSPRMVRFDLDRVADALERYTVEEIK
jgi:excisionase family DNA binding protein